MSGKCDLTDSDSEVVGSRSDQKGSSIWFVSSDISIPYSTTWLGKVQTFFLSNKFHVLIVVLVVLDCLCVAGKLTIESLHNEKNNATSRSSSREALNRSQSDSFNCTCLPINETLVNGLAMNPAMCSAEKVFKYASFAILSVFVFEIVLRIIFVPKVFTRFLELFDTMVILVSFGLSLFLVIKQHDVYSFTGMVTILRFEFKIVTTFRQS
jgi:hypothetical protein